MAHMIWALRYGPYYMSHNVQFAHDFEPFVSQELDQISKDSKRKQSRMVMIMLSTDLKSLSQTVTWPILLLLPLLLIPVPSKNLTKLNWANTAGFS